MTFDNEGYNSSSSSSYDGPEFESPASCRQTDISIINNVDDEDFSQKHVLNDSFLARPSPSEVVGTTNDDEDDYEEQWLATQLSATGKKTPQKRKQKNTIITTPSTLTSEVKTKKRKVSMSPSDTLVQSTNSSLATTKLDAAAIVVTKPPLKKRQVHEPHGKNSSLGDDNTDSIDHLGSANDKTVKTITKKTEAKRTQQSSASDLATSEPKKSKPKKIASKKAVDGAPTKGTKSVKKVPPRLEIPVSVSIVDSDKVLTVAKRGRKKNKGPAKTSTSTHIEMENTKKESIACVKKVTKETAETSDKAGAEALSKPSNSNTSVSKQKEATNRKKEKKTFEDELLNIMFVSCKPYTVKELVKAMGPIANETSVTFCLLSLIDKQWIIRKEFTSNRSKELFWANQECKNKELCGKLHFVPTADIQATRRELGALQQRLKSIHAELNTVLANPSNETLSVQCQAAEANVHELNNRLQAMKQRIANASNEKDSGKSNHRSLSRYESGRQMPSKKMTPSQIMKKINAMRYEWRTRKIKCTDFVDQLSDGMEKKVKDVVKLLELVTDEMVGVKIPPKYDV